MFSLKDLARKGLTNVDYGFLKHNSTENAPDITGKNCIKNLFSIFHLISPNGQFLH